MKTQEAFPRTTAHLNQANPELAQAFGDTDLDWSRDDSTERLRDALISVQKLCGGDFDRLSDLTIHILLDILALRTTATPEAELILNFLQIDISISVMGAASTRTADQPAPARPEAGNNAQLNQTVSDARQYIPKLDLSQVKGGMSKGTLSCYDHECPAVWGKIKNTGDRTVSRVVVTAYFPDATGKVVFEKQYSAVTTGGLMNNDAPLRPGYIKEFGYVVEGCPTECVPQNVRVSVTDVDFVADAATASQQ